MSPRGFTGYRFAFVTRNSWSGRLTGEGLRRVAYRDIGRDLEAEDGDDGAVARTTGRRFGELDVFMVGCLAVAVDLDGRFVGVGVIAGQQRGMGDGVIAERCSRRARPPRVMPPPRVATPAAVVRQRPTPEGWVSEEQAQEWYRTHDGRNAAPLPYQQQTCASCGEKGHNVRWCQRDAEHRERLRQARRARRDGGNPWRLAVAIVGRTAAGRREREARREDGRAEHVRLSQREELLA